MASTEPYIGGIKTFGFNFAPISYMTCSGQLLSIAEYTALFSLLGTTYGGDGVTTFALPDLCGRIAIHQGQGPGLPNQIIGEVAGTPSTTLTLANLPAHNHVITGTVAQPCNSGSGNTDDPAGAIPAGSATHEDYAAANSATGAMSPAPVTGAAQIAGGSQPFDHMPPYLVLNVCIAIEGIYPSRN